MDQVKHTANPSLSEIVKAVLDIDDCDLINRVITVLITPRKATKKTGD
ncbi:MAG TPA: hypothetical protein VKA08_13755 [Balneolales bacterium]|nr:hypothetical protein [Balneolales bacterium]